MNTTTTADNQKKPAALEREVEEVRDRLSHTVDALGARFSPGEVLDQVLGAAKEHGGEFGHNLGNQVKQNPLPLLLTGIGLAWMMSGARSPTVSELSSFNGSQGSHPDSAVTSHNTYGTTDTSGGLAAQAKDRVVSAGQRVTVGVGGVKDDIASSAGKLKTSAAAHAGTAKEAIANTASSVQENAKTAAHKTQEGFSQMLDEQPLMMAALGVAVGAALGAMLPTSQRENELMGGTRDDLVNRGREVAAKQYEKGREAVKDTAQKVEASIRESGSSTTSPVS